MFTFDARGLDEPEAEDRSCWECGRPIARGTRCTPCWVREDVGDDVEGGEA